MLTSNAVAFCVVGALVSIGAARVAALAEPVVGVVGASAVALALGFVGGYLMPEVGYE